MHELTGTTHSEDEVQNVKDFISNLDMESIDFTKLTDVADQYGVLDMADAEFHRLTGIQISGNEMQNAVDFVQNIDLSTIDWETVSAEELKRFGISQDIID